jgi:KaiC/GvpD/RAD55 family RecA-like ATPase
MPLIHSSWIKMVRSSRSKNQKPKVSYIPSELLQFVQRDTYSLLIKGDAGTGKTTLSLSILRALNIKSNFFYISTRISTKQLFTYYPWLHGLIEKPKMSPAAGETPHKGYTLSSFEDARLDEPESLFERITNQLMDVKAPIIIIDSWDAIASFMDKEARLNNERVLQTWCERAGAKLILISEYPTNKTLDFLVDGIVELQYKFHDDLKIREILLSKLRGIEIKKPSYIYSLNDGIFRSYSSYSLSDFDISSNFACIHKEAQALEPLLSKDSYVTSGYEALDADLGGGFPSKGIVLIDTDPSINVKITTAFLAVIISKFGRSCNPVIIQPSSIFDANFIECYMNTLVRIDAMKKGLVQILYPIKEMEEQGETSLDVTDYGYLNKFQRQFELFRNVIAKTRQEHPDKVLLNVLGMETPTSGKINKTNEIKILDIISFVRSNSDLCLLLTTNSQDMDDHITRISDIYLKLKTINGTLCLHSVRPSMRLYALTTITSIEYPKVKLEPLV